MTRRRIKVILYVMSAIIFLSGVGALAYPHIADWWNAKVETKAFSDYSELVRNFDKETAERFFRDADKYNSNLALNPARFTPSEAATSIYNSIMDTSGTGIICYVEVPKINVRLPVYHGTDDAVLQVAVGHMEGSSFPTGKPGTHSVFSGHNGLMSAMIFTELSKVEIGDVFYVTVLGNKLDYVVDQIEVVWPDNFEYFGINANKSYVTLVTCTPFGVNDHRLLVRGSRVDYSDGVNRIKIRFT